MWPVAAIPYGRDTEHSVTVEGSSGQRCSEQGWRTRGCPRPVYVNGFAGTQPCHLFTYRRWLLSTPRQQSPVVAPETLCFLKPKIFTIWIWAEKMCDPCSKTNNCSFTNMSRQIPAVRKVKLQGLGTEQKTQEAGPCTPRFMGCCWKDLSLAEVFSPRPPSLCKVASGSICTLGDSRTYSVWSILSLK